MFRTKVPQPDTSGGAPPKGRVKCSIFSGVGRGRVRLCYLHLLVGGRHIMGSSLEKRVGKPVVFL
jgi:hypothetical protein